MCCACLAEDWVGREGAEAQAEAEEAGAEEEGKDAQAEVGWGGG